MFDTGDCFAGRGAASRALGSWQLFKVAVGVKRGVRSDGQGGVALAVSHVRETPATHSLQPHQAALTGVIAATVLDRDRGTTALAAPAGCSPP